MSSVVIPGLPDHLTVVPPAPSSPTDPDADEKRLAWRRWRYGVHVYRVERHRELRDDPGLIPFELAKCAQHPDYWASIWLRVFEPRWRADPNADIPVDLEADDPDAEMTGAKTIAIPSVPLITQRNLRSTGPQDANYDPALAPIFGYVPFIPFADQVRVTNELLWSLTQDDEHADVVWSKSRGWGASWVICKLGLWGWTFSHLWPGAPPFNTLFLSRKEEYVDSKQQKSLFWKIRRLMRDMPDWMMPDGFNPDFHDQKGIIINPMNGNELGGESTNTNAGRGDRVTFAVLDEAAAIPALLNKWATLAETTDHRWALSTESFDQGSDFHDLQHSDEFEFKPWRIESDFWQNPLNDAAWLARQEKRYASNRDAYMQEVWRKPFTGSTWVYPWAADITYDPAVRPVSGYVSYIAADPGYRDPTALIAVQETPDGLFNVLDAYQISGKEADYFAPLLKPSLFADIDPNWKDKSRVEWSHVVTRHQEYTDEHGVRRLKPIEEVIGPFDYDERALRFARCVDAMGTPRIVGDTSGESVVGATKDSVYSRWRKYGLTVNTDRKTGDAVTTRVKVGRTHKGRQEAMHELSRRWRFADTTGAKMVGNAWKNSKYKAVPEKNAQNEPKEPEHDSGSHLRTAAEYLAVYVKHRVGVISREYAKPQRAKMGTGQRNNFGKAHLRASLGGVR